jgi:23S rRNA pseudouridine1911/1915/1917 synthase
MTTVCQMSIDGSAAGQRLDVFLARRLAAGETADGYSRAEIQRLIVAGQITLNGTATKSSARLKINDRIVIQPLPARETRLRAEPLPLEILHEDADCLVINKAPGVVVHPAAGQSSGTLVNALLYHCPDLAGIGGERRPGIVHRLDKETSGAMIVAKNMTAFRNLAGQFKNREVRKEYLALVWGRMVPEQGRINRPIGRHRSDRKRMSSTRILKVGREAQTEWEIVERFLLNHGKSQLWVSLVRLQPRTGRTHQLRVHLADMGYPIVGDKLYGRKRKSATPSFSNHALLDHFPRHALHARRLTVDHVRSHKRLEFDAPIPDDMRELLEFLRATNVQRAAQDSGEK